MKILINWINVIKYSIGQSGLGKSTMINTLFAAHLLDNKATQKASDPIRQTTEINTITHSK